MYITWLSKPKPLVDWYDGVPIPAAASRSSNYSEPQLPVIVLGAGAAGLTAAAVLEQNNVSVTVLEARDRIGGRIHTLADENATVDAGAIWIDGVPGNPLYQLVTNAGLETIPADVGNPSRLRIFDSDGRTLRWYQPIFMLYYVFRFIGRCQKGYVANYRTMEERINEEIPDRGHLRVIAHWFADFITEMNFAAAGDLVSPNCWMLNPDYDDDGMVLLKGGYGKLIDLLAKEVSDIRRGCVVEAILAQDNHVQVRLKSGESLLGSHVIVALPLGVLKASSVEFQPPLSLSKLEAIQKIGFGSLEKIIMRFSEPFWRKCRDTPMSFMMVPKSDGVTADRFPSFLDMSETSGAWVLVAMETGRKETAEEALVEKATNKLKTLFPQSYLPPLEVRTTWWRDDPYSRGSYSFPGLDTERRHYSEMSLPEGNGRILFAGEATSLDHSGYVGGAMESGVREARRILGFAAPLRSRMIMPVDPAPLMKRRWWLPVAATIGAGFAMAAALGLVRTFASTPLHGYASLLRSPNDQNYGSGER